MTKKKHHYVPRMLLKRFAFCEDKKIKKYSIYMYDKDSCVTRKVDIFDTARKNNLYKVTESNIVVNPDCVEDNLSVIERIADKVIDKITKSENLEQQDISIMLSFIVLQFLRSKENFDIEMNIMKETFPQLPQERLKTILLSNLILGGKGEVSKIQESFLKMLSENRHLTIFKSKIPFLISDNPVLLEKMFEDFGDWQFFLPISPYFCLTTLPNEEPLFEYKSISNNIVTLLNKEAEKRGRYIYSNNKYLLKAVEQQTKRTTK